MGLSVADLIHRSIVFGAIGFGVRRGVNSGSADGQQVYGSVVIGQNYVVKKRRLQEYEAQQRKVGRGRARERAAERVLE